MPTRRQILIGGGLAGGGLLLGFALSGPSRPERAAELAAGEGESFVTTWLKIDTDNRVTVYVPHCDMGQGILTALPMMAAEEMEADWQLVGVEQAPADPTFANGPLGYGYLTQGAVPSALVGPARAGLFKVAEIMNLQITGGSTAVRFTGHYGMRVAGAAAKEMLIRAAAQRWDVAESECEAKLSQVHHRSTGRMASFGELAAAASEFDPPSRPTLKDPGAYTVVGTPKQRFDIPAKVTGTAAYAIDVRVPDMVYAAVMPAPVFGGDVARYDGAVALKRRGVSDVFAIPGAVVVVADSYWRAQQALGDVEVEFTDGGNGAVSSESIFAQFDRALDGGEVEADLEAGDVAAGLAAAAQTVEAAYRVPYLAHATMEPMNCVAHVADGKAEVWVGVQDALGVRAYIADALGLSLDDVTFHPMLLGGGFGRRGSGSPNFIDHALEVAKRVGKPVKLVWSRENDIQQDYYRPAVSARMTAGLDADGKLTAFEKRYIRKDEPAEAALIPYAVENQSIGFVESPTHVPYGPWRSVAHTQHTFFNESFVDELAHAAGKDSYVFRRELLTDAPRHLAVLDLAAQKGGWNGPLPLGRARGIAIQESFQTIVAQVVEISIDPAGDVKVHKVTCAVDCGSVINPQIAASQIESGVIYGLTAALYGEITIEDGAVVQENFPDYEMVRLSETPVIDVHFIESGAALGGLGEPGTPPIAPAVANAIFALTGERLRTLPVMNHDLGATSRRFASRAAD